MLGQGHGSENGRVVGNRLPKRHVYEELVAQLDSYIYSVKATLAVTLSGYCILQPE